MSENDIIYLKLLFSDTGKIELLPALPKDLKSGSIKGLAARCRVIVDELTWDMETGRIKVQLTSFEDVSIRLKCGIKWKTAIINGIEYNSTEYIILKLKQNESAYIEFKL